MSYDTLFCNVALFRRHRGITHAWTMGREL